MLQLLGKPSLKLTDKCKNIATAFVLKLAWVMFIAFFINDLQKEQLLLQVESPKLVFFMACVWAPIWEEVVFRWAPITIAKGMNEKLLWPVIIISSAIFGWGHGEGPYSLLIQGMGGIMLSFLYIKNNYSLWSSIVLHSMWNTFVIFLI
jgi:membrane protease YdiL (CAAX protease family)